MNAKVSFTTMEHGTQADYELLEAFHKEDLKTLADRDCADDEIVVNH